MLRILLKESKRKTRIYLVDYEAKNFNAGLEIQYSGGHFKCIQQVVRKSEELVKREGFQELYKPEEVGA